MRSGAPALAVGLACACGARTGISDHARGEVAGAPPGVDASVVCTRPPWVLFDYSDGQGKGGIAAVRSDGTSFHVLDLGDPRPWYPSVSPDGATLLYLTASADGTSESLMLRDLAAGAVRPLVQVTVQSPSAGLGKAAVSPDGKRVAYGNSPDLRLVGIDGSNDRLLVQGPYAAGCCNWSYGHPTFSADSGTVYFSTIGRLESVRTDGSGRQLLEQDRFFSNPQIPGMVFPDPSLSPGFTEMVAQVACDVSELRVYPVDALPGDACTTGRELVETHTSLAYNEASNPSWARTGGPTGLVAYDDGADVLLIESNGGAPTNLTGSVTTAKGASAEDPVWAPGCANLP